MRTMHTDVYVRWIYTTTAYITTTKRHRNTHPQIERERERGTGWEVHSIDGDGSGDLPWQPLQRRIHSEALIDECLQLHTHTHTHYDKYNVIILLSLPTHTCYIYNIRAIRVIIRMNINIHERYHVSDKWRCELIRMKTRKRKLKI